MSAPSFLGCRWERVVWFTRGLSIHSGKEPALSTGCIGERISVVDVDVVTEREKGYVPTGVETREHTHTARYASLFFEVPQRTHARTPIYILPACKQSPKLLVLSEAAFVAQITVSKIERIKRKRK